MQASAPDPSPPPFPHHPEAPAESELFPREMTLGMVEEELERRRRLEIALPWILAAALTALALAWPHARIWGAATIIPAGGGEPLTAWGPWVAALGDSLDWRPEQVWFFLGALGYGLAFGSLCAGMRRIGFGFESALPAALLAIFSPLAWIGGRVAGDFGLSLWLATCALDFAFRRTSPRWVRLCALGPALLHPLGLVLIPAILWAGLRPAERDPGANADAGPSPLMPLLVGLGTMGLALYSWVAAEVDPLKLLWQRSIAGGGSGPGILLMWTGFIALGLGGAALGLWSLASGRRDEQESPPPAWLLLWCASAAIPVLLGTPLSRPALSWLLPAAAIGLADWLGRLETEELMKRALAQLALLQIALTAALTFAFIKTDPLADLRRAAQEHLAAGDLLLCTSEDVLHLARNRWVLLGGAQLLRGQAGFLDLDSEAWRERIAPALVAAEGGPGRIVIHGEVDGLGAEVRARLVAAGALGLGEGGLRTFR